MSIGCTLLGLIILTVGTVAYLIYQGGNELFNTDIHVTAPQGIETEENGKYVVYNGETYQFNEKVTNVLCIGVDKRNLDEIITVKSRRAEVRRMCLCLCQSTLQTVK